VAAIKLDVVTVIPQKRQFFLGGLVFSAPLLIVVVYH
jgi:hypothetical protein